MGSANLDVPQVVALAPLRFRHACAIDADLSLRVAVSESGAPRYELLARGLILPTVLPRAATLIGVLQAAEAAATASVVPAGAELLRVTGDPHANVSALCVPELRTALAQSIGAPTTPLQPAAQDATLPPISEEDADAVALLVDVPWLDLSGVIFRSREPTRASGKDAPRLRADIAVREMPEVVMHAQPLRGPAARAAVDACAVEIPLE